MSTGTYTYSQVVTPVTGAILFTDAASSPGTGMRMQSGDIEDVWLKVGDVLRSAPLPSRALSAGVPAAWSRPSEQPQLRRVSGGLVVTQDEYDTRFAGLPLEDYQRRMAPAVFEAYVRFVGLVPGDPRFDVVEAATQVED
jgi:hypothetical protein